MLIVTRLIELNLPFASKGAVRFNIQSGQSVSMRIMIVDDHAAMRRVLKSVVLSIPHVPFEFIECESGEDAVVQYALNRPDCVLMDVQLKQMNGFDATKRIRTMDVDANVVIVTSFDSPSIRLKAEAMSVMGFVSKDHLTDLHPILLSLNQDPSNQ